MSIVKAEALPEITREGSSSELVLEIRECLKDSILTGDAYKINELHDDKTFNNMQQRIRTQAKKLGTNVTIRRVKSEDTLYFAAVNDVKSAAKSVSDDKDNILGS